MIDLEVKQINFFLEWLTRYGPRLLLAVVVLSVGWIMSGLLARQFRLFLERRKIDATLTPFVGSFASIGLKVLVVITVAGIVGVETTSLAALIGATGFAIGLALQGNLANFAGGLVILILKPFKAGDFIEAQGEAGTVKEITIFHTVLNTIQNIRVMIPNGALASGTLKNYSAEATRRTELNIGISYSADIKLARKVVFSVLENDPRVLKVPAPECRVSALADSSVNLLIRAWAKTEEFWPMQFDSIENIKVAFDQNGIEIPFPQRTVHIVRKDLSL